MLKKFVFPALTFFPLSFLAFTVAAADVSSPDCIQLNEKASGDMTKYSLHGDANGPLFFSGISCAVKHRNKVLCAMEMISFDTTAIVHDYFTAEEIEIGKAHFWLDEKNNKAPIVAFRSKEDAEKYGSETGGGVILDYTGLTEKDLK